MGTRKDQKVLNVHIPSDLYDMYAKTCIDLQISKTEGIVRYFQYLKKTHHKKRRALDENTDSDFTLDDRDH